ncbi:RlpA-like double-psi beta-barrel-protein domain-containing protein-containing protein [Aspergillus pseudoustus]|uniref:RlpA-like double-psi beta-barrel-protein domain-containing protein-containing protein n=1 Tax=Aspergillus pseudoustus TaxID=1810923 RepID=A0ABR4JJA2_9EURO
MKYQRFTSIALAALSASTTVSAFPLKSEENSVCPPGYSASVYYITVTAEATPTSTLTSTTTTTTTSTSTTTITSTTTASSVAATAGEIETISTSSVAEEPESTVSEVPTQVAVVQPSTTTTATTTTTQASTTSASEAPAASSSTSSSSAATTGEATFYGGNVSGGTCSFTDYTLPSDLSGVAFSGEAWDDAANCGRCVTVTGPSGNSIKAMIVDKCPECAPTHLDLFEEAFTELAPASKGVIDISFSYVPCGIDSPLILKNKEGTSQYWFSMQVVNANEAVESLEVSTDGGSNWRSTARSFYNFFENSAGFGTDTVDVRVTGTSGKTVVVKSVSVSSGSSTTASGNV